MTELAIAVDADDELWTLDNLPTPEAPYVEVESELIEVRSRFPSSYYTLTGETLPPRIRVRRGIAGTTKASHIQGSTLTPNYGLGGGVGGAGGVTVDNQSDPPAEVTTLIAPGATIDGDEATFHGIFVTGTTVDMRGQDSAENTGGIVSASHGDEDNGRTTVSGGNALADNTNGGSARIQGGSGDSGVINSEPAFAIFEGGSLDGTQGRIEMAASEITFNISAAPEVPATPSEQDIVDALVTLGLITQAAP